MDVPLFGLKGAADQKAELENKMRLHNDRINDARPTVDTSAPSSILAHPKRIVTNKGDRITKENFILAQRLYQIMEKPSATAVSMQHKPSCNPNSLNFKLRADNAQKINILNQKIASRLFAVKPHYVADSKVTKIPMKNDRLPLLRAFNIGGGVSSPGGRSSPRATNLRQFSAATDSSIERLKSFNVNQPPSMPSPPRTKPKGRKPKIILEYTKEQGDYVIDTVVIKEPYRDRYAIFGIDVMNGQRFELFLRSEKVFNLLEGDMLVTSVEKKDVWAAVLERVMLEKVERFSKIRAAWVAVDELNSHAAWSQPEQEQEKGPQNHADDEGDGEGGESNDLAHDILQIADAVAPADDQNVWRGEDIHPEEGDVGGVDVASEGADHHSSSLSAVGLKDRSTLDPPERPKVDVEQNLGEVPVPRRNQSEGEEHVAASRPPTAATTAAAGTPQNFQPHPPLTAPTERKVGSRQQGNVMARLSAPAKRVQPSPQPPPQPPGTRPSRPAAVRRRRLVVAKEEAVTPTSAGGKESSWIDDERHTPQMGPETVQPPRKPQPPPTKARSATSATSAARGGGPMWGARDPRQRSVQKEKQECLSATKPPSPTHQQLESQLHLIKKAVARRQLAKKEEDQTQQNAEESALHIDKRDEPLQQSEQRNDHAGMDAAGSQVPVPDGEDDVHSEETTAISMCCESND